MIFSLEFFNKLIQKVKIILKRENIKSYQGAKKQKNCSKCEYYFANSERDIGLCRMDIYDKIDIDNAENTCCILYKRWSMI